MKTRALLLLVLICLPLAFVFIPPTSADSSQLVIDEAQRDVELQIYGMILVTDTITISNLGPVPAFNIMAAYPLAEIKNVKEFTAATINGTSLYHQRIARIGPNCTGWQVFLAEPLMPEQTVTFTVQMAIEGLVTIDETTATASIPIIVTSPYNITSYSTRLTYHDALTAPTQTSWTGDSVHPYSFELRAVILDHITDDFAPIISYLELKRTFYIDAWGYLFAQEAHMFRLESVNPRFTNSERRWNSLTVTLPAGSEFLRVFDNIANLSNSRIETPTNVTHPGSIAVQLRYHLEEGDVYQFFLEYRIPLDLRQLVLQTGQALFFEPYYKEPWIIRNQITEFILPSGSWLQGVPIDAETTSTPTGQYLISFSAQNVTSLHQSNLSLFYVYPVLPALARPMLFFVVIGAACLVYITARRVSFFREEEEIIAPTIEIDPIILDEFCTFYGEKIALLLQTEKLEQTMLQGKISKPRYRKEKKNFERKIRAIDRELSTRSQPLIEAGGKYESAVRQLELLEAERVSSIEALHALEQRYRQKRITAQVYQKLQKDLQKRRDKAVGRMDRILLSLREELAL
ncbi:MAG: hypothetical protein ACFFD8_00445 [Candidatus Thorarchaeota archaeon]